METIYLWESTKQYKLSAAKENILKFYTSTHKQSPVKSYASWMLSYAHFRERQINRVPRLLLCLFISYISM